MENIETGLLLMVVGMATVFLILLIIIYTIVAAISVLTHGQGKVTRIEKI